MKGYKVAALYLFILLAVACGTGKKSIVHETKVLDSVIVKVETVKAPLLSDVLTIKELCPDSVKATEFKRVFIRDTDTIVVEIVNDSLQLKITQSDKIVSELRQQLGLRVREIKQLTTQTKGRTQWKLPLILSAVVLLFVLFPGIPRALNTFFGKLISGGF